MEVSSNWILGSGWGIGKDSSQQDGGALEQNPQGSGHGPKMLEFRKRFDAAFRYRVCILGCAVWSWELELVTLADLLQLEMFCDSTS